MPSAIQPIYRSCGPFASVTKTPKSASSARRMRVVENVAEALLALLCSWQSPFKYEALVFYFWKITHDGGCELRVSAEEIASKTWNLRTGYCCVAIPNVCFSAETQSLCAYLFCVQVHV